MQAEEAVPLYSDNASEGSTPRARAAFVQMRVTPQFAGTITNTASLQGVEADLNTANNSASATTQVKKK